MLVVVITNRIEEEQIEGRAGPDCLRAVYICGFLMQCEWVVVFFSFLSNKSLLLVPQLFCPPSRTCQSLSCNCSSSRDCSRKRL